MLRTARFLVIALLASFLADSAAQGLPPRTETHAAREVGPGEWAMRILRQFWAFVSKEGAAADPSGVSSSSQLKEGGAADPSGACAPGPGCSQQPAGQGGTATDPSLGDQGGS